MMTSRKQGIDVEAAFRAVFHIDPSVDFMELMDAAIDVASAIYPQEYFKKRTKKLINDLDETIRMRAAGVENNPKKSDDHDPCTKANNKCHDEKDDEKKVVVVASNNEEKKVALDLKFENSKRRFQQGHDEIRKGKRKIQLLDSKDVPKLPPRKVLCSKSRAIRLKAVR